MRPKHDVGEKVKVIADNSGHHFKIGKTVIIREVFKEGDKWNDTHYGATYTNRSDDWKNVWYVDDEEISEI